MADSVARARADWLAAGRVGRPHGLDGSFHVTRPRGTLLALGNAVRVGDEEAEIVRLAGHEGRAAAEALRGLDLLVHRTAAPALDEDEWYAEDLEGCRVVDRAAAVGRVVRMVALPSCEALEVAREGAADLLVPLVRDAVRSVDVAAGVVDVDLAFLGEQEPGPSSGGRRP